MKANHKFDTSIFWSKDPGKTLVGKRDRERITLAGKQDRERITLVGKQDRERIFIIQEILTAESFQQINGQLILKTVHNNFLKQCQNMP